MITLSLSQQKKNVQKYTTEESIGGTSFSVSASHLGQYAVGLKSSHAQKQKQNETRRDKTPKNVKDVVGVDEFISRSSQVFVVLTSSKKIMEDLRYCCFICLIYNPVSVVLPV